LGASSFTSRAWGIIELLISSLASGAGFGGSSGRAVSWTSLALIAVSGIFPITGWAGAATTCITGGAVTSGDAGGASWRASTINGNGRSIISSITVVSSFAVCGVSVAIFASSHLAELACLRIISISSHDSVTSFALCACTGGSITAGIAVSRGTGSAGIIYKLSKAWFASIAGS